MPDRCSASFWLLIALVSVALLLRLGWGITRPTSESAVNALPDQGEYLSITRSLLRGEGPRFYDSRFGQFVYAYRMPGYPLFLALCGGRLRVVRAVQSLVDASTVLAVYLLSRRLLSDRWGSSTPSLVAAGLIAFNPFQIYFSGLVLSETLFTAMLIWAMWFLVAADGKVDAGGGRRLWRMFDSPSWWGGITLLALSVYVRPAAIPLAPLLVGGAEFLNRGRVTSYQRLILRTVKAAALVVLALLPWAYRNSRPDVLGRWIWTTTNGGITAYDGWNPRASGASDQAFVREMPELRAMGEVERSAYLSDKARRFVTEEPGWALKLMLMKFVRTWTPIPLSRQFGSPGLVAVAALHSVPFDLLLVMGLLRGKLSGAAKVFLMLPAIYLTGVHAASVGSLRYRLPAIPPMAVLAGSVMTGCRRAPGAMG